jgi:hypothetical protein
VLGFVAEGMRDFIVDIGPDYDLGRPGDLNSFSDRARSHWIETGVRLKDQGLRHQSPLGEPQVLDLPGLAPATSHQIVLRVVSTRGLEELEAGAAPLVMLSADGADALIAWQQDGQLRYQESRGEGWSGVRAISLATIDLERALEVVAHRIRNR